MTEPMLDEGWVDHARTLTAEQLDIAGVGIGRLGLTHDGDLAVFRCSTCRRMFTVTGPPGPEWGEGCLSDDCASYDIARDVDIFFEPAFEAGIIRRRSV